VRITPDSDRPSEGGRGEPVDRVWRLRGMTGRSAVVVGLAVAALTACGSGASQHASVVEVPPSSVSPASPTSLLSPTSLFSPSALASGSSSPTSTLAPASPGTAPAGAVHAVVAGVDSFTGDLATSIARPGVNAVFSPLSISTALSLVRVGARGQTATEIDRVAHFPAAGRDTAFASLLRGLVTTSSAPPVPTASPSSSTGAPPKPVVAIADGVFAQDSKTIDPGFLDTLQHSYGAPVQTVDFTSPQAVQALNSWGAEHTAHRITKIFDSLDPSTQLVLANAVYLKAAWLQPFLAELTKPAAFHTAGGAVSRPPTMHQHAGYAYAETGAFQAVELPYAGGTLAMLILLPRAVTDPAALLAGPTLLAAQKALTDQLVDLSLPTWKTSSDVDLATVLQGLGIRTAFGPGADLSGIGPGLSISQAVHRATITVDETGTEAAAVTAFAIAGSAKIPPPVPVTMTVDHPFAYAVLDTTTGTPLFTGVINDPATTS